MIVDIQFREAFFQKKLYLNSRVKERFCYLILIALNGKNLALWWNFECICLIKMHVIHFAFSPCKNGAGVSECTKRSSILLQILSDHQPPLRNTSTNVTRSLQDEAMA